MEKAHELKFESPSFFTRLKGMLSVDFYRLFHTPMYYIFLAIAAIIPAMILSMTTMETPDGQHRNQIDYILCSQRWRSSIQSAKTRPGADCGSDHELLIAKFRLKLKKVGKTTRPFRYDLNQIPYDYTVEVRNRFKGLDLIDRVPDELWTEVHDIVQERGIKPIFS